ncbi:unnamed protein product [Anisakis simplex]|uniref:DUF3995 domain-containing protein n=1 Tax=Anisakis simplex TaxID=6269 RepID=A0A0M3J7E3_ANISI|nr:unnamed protein product [Anisakis simplex]
MIAGKHRIGRLSGTYLGNPLWPAAFWLATL